MILRAPKLLMALLLLTSSNAWCQEDYPIAKAIEDSRTLLTDVLDEFPGASASVIHKGEILWEEGFGFADLSQKEQVTTDHRFLYYSLSKSMLGAAIYRLTKEGKLDIDDSITKYLPDLPKHYGAVSIRHLLGHTAGVRHYNKGEWVKISMDRCTSPKEAIEIFINDPLAFEPGSKYQYSSFGYVLLSHLLTEVTNMSFDEYFEQAFFTPFEIESIIRPENPEPIEGQATRYEKWNAKKSKGTVATVNNSCKFGGGGFIGTASDLAVFHSKILESEKGSSLYQSLNSEGLSSYGYGLGINDKSENVYYSHTGSGRGGSAVVLIYPKYDLVITLLGNTKGDGLVKNIGQIGGNFKKAIDN